MKSSNVKNERILYGISAIYNTPDEILHAAGKVSDAGYKKYDVHTPYPVHGLDNAMKTDWPILGYVAMFLGLSGAAFALLFMYWSMSIDYPNVIGGKPFFSLPAFIPVTFEVTVLAASIGTLFTMLAVVFKFPNNAHPLHDTAYMDKVSSDKYGIVIEAKDMKFDREEVVDLFKLTGSEEIIAQYYDSEILATKINIFEPKFVTGLIAMAIVTSAVTYFSLNVLMDMKPFTWMQFQKKLSAMEPAEFYDSGFSMRTPVAGTVSRGHKPYAYENDPEGANTYLSNPLLATAENLEVGQKKYDTFCSPCHGYYGEGDSRLRGQFPTPPSLHSSTNRNSTDGRLYHIITVGQNTMPSYARQLNPTERWQVISYIRTLQRALNAKEEDLK